MWISSNFVVQLALVAEETVALLPNTCVRGRVFSHNSDEDEVQKQIKRQSRSEIISDK
jgi:hypothetical protein